MQELARNDTLKTLKEIACTSRSEFVYIRGRRRVGKSWLLKKFAIKNPKICFFFTGAQDARIQQTIKEFVVRWTKFSSNTSLSNYKISSLTWPTIFEEISNFANKRKDPIVLIFDEIQWMAKEGSGFIGYLKEAWVTWQKTQKIKVIICGSSNKFFNDVAGGEEKILRGMQTRPTIWLHPISPVVIKNDCCQGWNLEEATLLYMMIGGIPYYLENIEFKKGFVHAINDGLFTNKSNLLEEAIEVINLDFNLSGQKSVLKILSALGQDGCAQSTIAIKTGLPKSTVSKIISKLVDYEIVFEKMPYKNKLSKNNEGIRYFMKDFFLNFYFQILLPRIVKIQQNEKGLIFPYDIIQGNNYFIPQFSGKAFELFLRYILEKKIAWGNTLYQKLQLNDPDYTILDVYQADNLPQVDLIVEHSKDRIVRLIECKWGEFYPEYLDKLISIEFVPKNNFAVKKFLFVSKKPSAANTEFARRNNIEIVHLKDVFST